MLDLKQFGIGGVLAVAFAGGAAHSEAVTIDDFSAPDIQRIEYETLDGVPGTMSNTGDGSGILGGERDMSVTIDASTGGAFSGVEFMAGGLNLDRMTLNVDDDIDATAQIVWDGDDNDATSIDFAGLGGVNLGADANAFELGLHSADHLADVLLTVYTDEDNWSSLLVELPVTATFTTVYGLFGDFEIGAGAGADFTNVGAIVMDIDPNGGPIDLTMNFVATRVGVVPEPASAGLVGLGALLIGMRRNRRR